MEIAEQVYAELLQLDDEITKGLLKQDLQTLSDSLDLMEKNLTIIRGKRE